MLEQQTLFPASDGSDGDGSDSLTLAQFAQRAYLDYAISVVKGRALPDGADGQKPVQRRILFAMNEMGLVAGARPVKSARVVGDVLGRFHPHGDQAAYDAMVRMAQDFSLRYPLVDGQGNFGSRDGDGAAAMRYTEARLTPIARLLLDEIDEGTVAFMPNYDGSTQEPRLLPARLPFVLLNGASGIAVGMATEIPSHNLREVAAATLLLLGNPKASLDDVLARLPAPDFPGGGQIISSRSDIRDIYTSGRGSLKVRARYEFEELARGQLARLARRTVVVGHEVHRALVDLVEQQRRVTREPGLGIAHRRRAVAVARAEVALPVDQRVAQRERLRHAHQRIVGRGVAVGMVAPQHVAHDPRGLHRLGRGAEPHLVHRVQDASLNRLLAVADVGQRASLDDGDRVLEIGALRVIGQRQRVAGVVRGGLGEEIALGHQMSTSASLPCSSIQARRAWLEVRGNEAEVDI